MSSELLEVSLEEAGERLDKLLARRFHPLSRTYFAFLIEEGCILVNGETRRKRTTLHSGDEIEVNFIATPEIKLEPEAIPLSILYEDEELIAVNKPPGMVVHPAVGNWSGTFVNALLHHCKTLPQHETLRPGIVHRLDKETSGVLLAAKTAPALQGLMQQFAERTTYKEYIAFCLGHPKEQTISLPMKRHPHHRQVMAVVMEGKEAITQLIPLSEEKEMSCVKLIPKTGRTHQLRVHLTHIGHPIIGDQIYGNRKSRALATRQLLHAHKLRFTHPTTMKIVEVTAPLPPDMAALLNKSASSKMISL